MELWDAYNREGLHIEGVVLERGKPIPNGIYHLVCEVLVRHEDGSYLFMRRARTKKEFAGYWETSAGGSALQGESPLQCIRRELEEETGIVCNSFEQIGVSVDEEGREICHTYVCCVDCDKNGIRLQKGETEDFCWMTEQAFLNHMHSDLAIPKKRLRLRAYLENIET